MRLKSPQLQKPINQQKGRLDSAIEQYQQQFSEAQERRANQFREELDELAAEAESRLKERQIRAEDVVSGLEATKEEVERLAAAISGTTQAGHHKQYADDEDAAADLWRWIAVSAALIVAAMAVFAFLRQGPAVSWAVFWAKVVLALPFAAIATYAGRESGRHRRNAQRARDRQIDLLAIRPYLEDMDKTAANAIRSIVALRLFGRESEQDEDYEGDAPTGRDLTAKTIDTLMDLLKRGSE